jgi:hypothetical protein
MDLIQTLLFLAYLIFAGAAWLTTHIVLFRAKIKKENIQSASKASIIATIAVIVISLVHIQLIFGRICPPLEGGVLQDRHRQFIDDKGNSIEWWVEFVNPFDENHKERLVLVDEKDKRIINMLLLARTGFLSTHKSDDDPNLKQLGSNLLLTSKLETSPHQTRFVLFDYESGSVISNWVEAWKPPNTESNQSIDPIVTTPVD